MKQFTINGGNVFFVAVVACLGVAALWQEGYLGLVDGGFVAFALGMGGLALYFAGFEISRKRLVLLSIVAGVAGYVTQYVGATANGFWSYPGPRHSYYFVPATFAIASLVAFGLVQAALGPLARKAIRPSARWMNPWLASLPLVAVTCAAPVRAEGALVFFLYYGALGLLAIYGSLGMNLATLLSVFAAGTLVGTLAEIAGARSGLWSFATPPHWVPPWWLPMASWPLEVMAHYVLSGLLAGESLLARPRYFREPRLYDLHSGHAMHCAGPDQLVVCAKGPDKAALLDAVIEQAGLRAALERRLRETRKSKSELRVVIKPNFMFLYSEHDRSTFTDPALVERLVDWLRAEGFTDVAIVEAQSAYGNYFLDRGVVHVAKVAGYRPQGRYRIVDLTEEMVPHRFDGPLGDHVVGPTWRDADFRISFAKNKTHTWAWYTLCIKNIYGALAMQDKIREYHQKREIYYPTIDMLVAFPVHFGIIDAIVSADGPFGIFADRTPNQTDTIIAGENILAVDWVGASKMGLDPMVSRYMQLAVQAFGRPNPRIIGDASHYQPWENVPRPVLEFWDNAEESYGFTTAIFGALNRDYASGHFRRRPMSKFRATLTRLLSPLGAHVFKKPPPDTAKRVA